MSKREFLMAAHTSDNRPTGGWWWSEKLDGMRAFWDGGFSRGIERNRISWANCAENDTRPATGLWSRYGKVIVAPNFWLNALPCIPLDGELYYDKVGDDSASIRQILMSIVKKQEPEANWASVKYCVFDSPPLESIFADGLIDSQHYHKLFDGIKYPDFGEWNLPYKEVYGKLPLFCDNRKYIKLMPQNPIKDVQEHLKSVEKFGGEGIMLRNPNSYYACCRTYDLLKLKIVRTGIGRLVGFKTGQGKFLGMIGSLRVRLPNDRMVDISGLTNEQRELCTKTWAEKNPGETLPDAISAEYFDIGEKVKFKFSYLNNNNIPVECNFLEKVEC